MKDDYRKVKLVMALRTKGIRDTAVMAAMERVPRELFVDDAFVEKAYDDQSLPIECGQTISQPYIVAYMTEQLRVSGRMKVLEIGTGSGYQSAILSHLCRRLYTIERYRSLLAQAEARFVKLDIANITSMVGDGAKGWPEQAPFDRIIVTAAAPEIPRILTDQLKIGGIMVVPVNKGRDIQELMRLTREEEGLKREALLPVKFVPLVEGIASDEH